MIRSLLETGQRAAVPGKGRRPRGAASWHGACLFRRWNV